MRTCLLLTALGLPSVALASIDAVNGPASGNEGASLNYACLWDDEVVVTFDWDFDDGNTFSETKSPGDPTRSNVSHTYEDDGTYVLSCTASDPWDTDTFTRTITINNVAPSASASGPASALEGQSVSYSCSATDPGVNDILTYTWDFGDGFTATGPNVSHVFANDGNYAVTCTVDDGDGGVDTAIVNTVVDPSGPVIQSTNIPATAQEGELLSMSSNVFDTNGRPFTVTWDMGDGSSMLTGASVNHVYADDGDFTVTITATNDLGETDVQTTVVSVANIAPTTNIAGDLSGSVGDTLSFGCSATDPGSADTHTFSWDFDDGTTGSGASITHIFFAEGTYDVSCTSVDDDGGSSSATIAVTINDNNPDITTFVAPGAGDEGELLSFSAAATDPNGEALTYVWDFGDGGSATGNSVSHAYVDNGTYTVRVDVTNVSGFVSSATATTVVDNVAPVIGGTPVASVSEGGIFLFLPSMSDVGAVDTHTWTATAPAAAIFDDSVPSLVWSTGFEDIGFHPMSLTVIDDDGGIDILSWTLEVVMVDVDNDGMSDNWETANGLDPTDPGDAALDSDGDGMINLDEWIGGWDPMLYEGPEVPVLTSPVAGESVSDAVALLQVANTTSGRGLTPTYNYQLFDDSGLSNQVSSVTDIAQDPSGFTTWPVPVVLTENTWYWWWASASDPFTTSNWSLPESFFYSAINEAPGAPFLNTPFDGASVDTLTPTLVLDEASDPDNDVLTYTYVLTDDLGTIVAVQSNVAGDGVSADWTPGIELVDDTEYCWHAFAVDPGLLQGPDSSTSCFFVDLDNLAPSAPVIAEPADGSTVFTQLPDIVVDNGVDPEGRDTLHVFELDTDPSFGTGDYRTIELDTDPSGQTTWILDTELTEDTTWYVRVAATDGVAVSPQAEGSFFVNALNAAPPAPTLANPPDGGDFGVDDELEILNVDDPDGDAVTYDFVVYDEAGDEVATRSDVPEGNGGTTSWAPGELPAGDYSWTSRAIDEYGAEGDWADEIAFVTGEDEDPKGDDDDDDDLPIDTGFDRDADDPVTVDKKKGGCSCSASSSPVGWLALLGALTLVRRRR